MDLQQKIDSAKIYEDLCEKIEKLVYMPGQRISENELCSEYSATRHMVRGALTKLKQRRLIEVYPQRGTFVSLIDMKYIYDILYVRESIEQESVRRIIEKGEVERICWKMQENIEKQRQCMAKEQGTEMFYQLDNAFHRISHEEVGRGDVVEFIAEPYIHFRRWRNFEGRYENRIEQLIEEHERLTDAIREKDAGKARQCLREHLDTVSRYSKHIAEEEKKYIINA